MKILKYNLHNFPGALDRLSGAPAKEKPNARHVTSASGGSGISPAGRKKKGQQEISTQ